VLCALLAQAQTLRARSKAQTICNKRFLTFRIFRLSIDSTHRKHLTMAFSCGARSAFKLREKDYLKSMLSRRQLQGFVNNP
jgi:hypothetical protein